MSRITTELGRTKIKSLSSTEYFIIDINSENLALSLLWKTNPPSASAAVLSSESCLVGVWSPPFLLISFTYWIVLFTVCGTHLNLMVPWNRIYFRKAPKIPATDQTLTTDSSQPKAQRANSCNGKEETAKCRWISADLAINSGMSSSIRSLMLAERKVKWRKIKK